MKPGYRYIERLFYEFSCMCYLFSKNTNHDFVSPFHTQIRNYSQSETVFAVLVYQVDHWLDVAEFVTEFAYRQYLIPNKPI